MDKQLLEALESVGFTTDATNHSVAKTFMIKSPVVDYTARYRNRWFKPEYNFAEIQTAQDSDSYLAQAIEKKTLKFFLSKFEFSGENPQTVEYIKKRIAQIEIASNKPFKLLLSQTAQDLNRYNNAMWLLVRDEMNSGGRIYTRFGKKVKPISGIFILPFESLELLTNNNGDIIKVRQIIPNSSKRSEWPIGDIIHFTVNKRPGFPYASPVLFSAMEDIKLLRRIEEQVEELIESNLFPVFHYKIGTEKFPERVNVNTGLRESEEIQQTLEYMPSSGVYISDWRHEITAIGSENKALRIDYYLDYFKKRVFSSLSMSATDFGESDSANKSTSQTQSQQLIEAVEAIQLIVKTFIDMYLITPLLLESSFKFDVSNQKNLVEMSWSKIDTNTQNAIENSANQLYQSNAITHEELRHKIGHRPIRPDQEKSLNYNKFPDRAQEAKIAQLKAGSAGSTQAANQYGKTTKKSGAKKDYIINDLLEYWQLIKESITDADKRLSYKDELTERLYAILISRSKEFTNRSDCYQLTKQIVNSIYDKVDKKLELVSLYTVRLETVLIGLDETISELSNLIDELSLDNYETLKEYGI